jgi:hypothetical protein
MPNLKSLSLEGRPFQQYICPSLESLEGINVFLTSSVLPYVHFHSSISPPWASSPSLRQGEGEGRRARSCFPPSPHFLPILNLSESSLKYVLRRTNLALSFLRLQKETHLHVYKGRERTEDQLYWVKNFVKLLETVNEEVRGKNFARTFSFRRKFMNLDFWKFRVKIFVSLF